MNINQPPGVATVDREFGRMEGRLGALEQRHKELEQRIEKELGEIRTMLDKETGDIKEQLDKTNGSLDEIHGILQQVQGAVKLGGWLVAAVAAVGGAVSWFLGLWTFGGG